MSREPSNASTSLDDLIRLADEDRRHGESFLRLAGIRYQDILDRMPNNFERGLLAQKAWESEQRLAISSPYFSQAGQDRFLDERVFEHKRDGMFIEIGAYDGVTGSNCLFFEMMRNWTGLIVEPSPLQFETLKASRRSTCVQATIAPWEATSDFMHITNGYTQMSGLLETYDDAILHAVRENAQHREEILKVSTRRLDSLLDEHEIRKADYCSLDVEGAELAILSSFPFDVFDISVWTIENNLRTKEVKTLMEAKGYHLVTVIGTDEIFRKTNSGTA